MYLATHQATRSESRHVAPPRAPAANDVDQDKVNGQVLLGFCVPTLVVSPFTRNTGSSPRVSSVVFTGGHAGPTSALFWRRGTSVSASPHSAIQTVAPETVLRSSAIWAQLAATPTVRLWAQHPHFASQAQQ